MLLSKTTARDFVLHHQLPSPKKGKAGTLAAIEQIGYVQIDTISVIARAHHHVLWTRVPNYQPEFLKNLEEKDRAIFDYWAHAASYLPMRDYRFSLYRKQEIIKQDKHWYKKDPKNMAYLLDQFKERGPLMSKDLEKGNFVKNHAWGIPPIKQALMHLFMEGKIMIIGRQGFQKIYDLPEKILPQTVNTILPSRDAYIEHIIRRDIGAHGLMQSKEIGHLLKISIKEKEAALQQLVQTGELKQLTIKGLENKSYYAFTEKIENYQPKRRAKKFHILSPFDNLVILRKRIMDLFDFSYTLECYVPAAKRKVGYFSLPLLYGRQFVGQLDLKADRKKKILWIKNLVWESHLKKTEIDKCYEALWKKLQAFARFNECESIQTELEDDWLGSLVRNS
jgi:uncharacterized protein YcaQ